MSNEVFARLILKHDSSANWETNKDFVLMNGEPGVSFDENGKPHLKIGDGVTPWENLDWYADSSMNFYDVEFISGTDEDDMAAIARVVGDHPLSDGDIAIVKHPLSDSRFAHTGYVYSSGGWRAMDGNYNAENIFFDEDLQTTTAIGNIALTNGMATIPSTGKNLKEVWETIFVKEKTPSTTQPSVKITFSSGGAHEVGETVSASYSVSLDPGKYTYGPATGVLVSSVSVADSLGATRDTQTGSFDDVVVTDAMKSATDGGYKLTATVAYTDGAVPVTNRGNAYAAGQIKSGSKSASSAAITGYRNTFFGTLTSKSDALTSSVIRGLTPSNGAFAAGSKFDIAIPVGAMRVLFAYPASLRDVSSVTDENGMGAQIVGSFAKNLTTVQVEGANGATAIDYKVYYMDLSQANGTANVFHVTI